MPRANVRTGRSTALAIVSARQDAGRGTAAATNGLGSLTVESGGR